MAVGEQIPEVQVLGGLLIHSADNYADLLARWDAGSEAAFVAKMNADAAKLGMTQSHFADPSGVDPGSQSTPYDLLKVASLDMTNPVFASLVQQSSITLPVAGTISTYTPFLGFDGVIGVKSGFTSAAGGCDVLAVVRQVHGVPTLLLAAVTGPAGSRRPGPSRSARAGAGDRHGARGGCDAGAPPGSGRRARHRGRQDGDGPRLRPRSRCSRGREPRPPWSSIPPRHLTDQARRGAVVGTVDVTLGTQHASRAGALQQDVPQPTMLQRLF